MSRLQTRGWAFGVALWLLGPAARADEITLQASADTTLYAPDGNVSNARGTHLFTGINGARNARRALIRFDVATALPPGAVVRGARLELMLSRGHDGVVGLDLHRLSKAWGEGSSRATGGEGGGTAADVGDATWTHQRFPDTRWTSPGGDFAPAVSASLSVSALGNYAFEGAALVADVQAFLDAPTTNYGWIVLTERNPSGVAKRFESRESGLGAPVLRVVYDPPAEPTGACCAADGQCSVSLDPGATCRGTYQGAGSECAPDTCPPPLGACCTPDATASCEARTQLACGSPRRWLGAGASCALNPCPVVLTPFVDALPLPGAATPIVGVPGGAASYRMRMIQTQQKFHRDLPPTTVWGYADGESGGGYPGPTIEARSGEPVSVTWVNDLRDEAGELLTRHPLRVDTCLHGAESDAPRTVVHLHGGHVPSEFDGQPEATLLPGEEARYEYPNAQESATIWYHDHAVGITRLNVYMGLAGFYLVRDTVEDRLGLPAGKYEIPIAIQDRSFYPDGRLRYPESWQESFFGDNLVVNGKVSPYLVVDRGKYRFRLLNGSTSRTYTLSMSDGRPIMQIGADGGLLPSWYATKSLTISPGERADVVIDFQFARGELTLRNSAPVPFPLGGDGPDLADVLKFIVGEEDGHTAPLPEGLRPLPAPDVQSAVAERTLEIVRAPMEMCGAAMWSIDGREWEDITETPHLGTSEIWKFVNRSGVTHPMHLHSLFFRVIDRQGFRLSGDELSDVGEPAGPRRGELGWKDTVQVGPFESVRVLARFEDYAGRFPYHCHLIEHEDHGMMRQFEASAVCGDGALARGHEECDDGNAEGGDGCNATCVVEVPDAGAPDAEAEPAAEPAPPEDAGMANPAQKSAGGCSSTRQPPGGSLGALFFAFVALLAARRRRPRARRAGR